MKKAIRNIFLVLVIVCNYGYAQTFKADMLQLNKSYMGLKKFSYTANYTMYYGNSLIPSETYSMLFKKNNNEYYSKSADDEFMVNDRYLLYVDYEEKEVFIQNNSDKKSFSALNNPQLMQSYLDTLITTYKNVQLIENGIKDTKQYRFLYSEGPYSRVDLVIDTKTWLIKEMIMYCTEKDLVDKKLLDVKIKVEYNNYDLNPVFTTEFSETAHLQLQNGKFKLKPSFSKYVLYDQTHLQ